MRGRIGARSPALIISCENACARSLFEPSGSPRSKRFEYVCSITPGATRSVAG